MKETAVAGEGLEIRRGKRLKGVVKLPGDGSLAVYGLWLATLAEGTTRIENLPTSQWMRDMLGMLANLGFPHEYENGHVLILGKGDASRESIPGESIVMQGKEMLAPFRPHHENELAALAGLLAGFRCDVRLAVDPTTICGEALEFFLRIFQVEEETGPEEATAADGEAGVRIFSVRSMHTELPRGYDRGGNAVNNGGSKVGSNSGGNGKYSLNEHLWKIANVFFHLAAEKPMELRLKKPGPDMLEKLLAEFETGIEIRTGDAEEKDELARRIARQMKAVAKQEPETRMTLPAMARPQPQFLRLAGDVTLASVFALAATLVKGSDIALEGVLLNSGRTGFFTALKRMGADIEVTARKEKFGEASGNLRIRSAELLGRRFGSENLAGMKEEIFLLIIAAAFAEGETIFRDIGFLRMYRTDLLKSLIQALKTAGVEIGEVEDGIVVRGRAEYDGSHYDCLGNPILGIAYYVMGVKSHGVSTLAGSQCIDYIYPGLPETLKQLAEAP